MDLSSNPRLCELLERRWAGTMTDAERRELDEQLERDADARATADQLQQQEDTMSRTVDAAVEHFDFAKARRAIAVKLESDQALFRLQVLFAAVVLLIGAGFSIATGRWTGLALVAAAALLSLLGWAWVVSRRRGSARSSARSRHADAALAPHLRTQRTEFTLMRACVVLGGLGMLALLLITLAQGHALLAIIPVVVLVLAGPPAVHRFFGRSALRRRKQYLAGDLSRSAWRRGEDGTA